MGNKAMTLRIPAERAAELEAVARADDRSVNQTVLDAIERLIEERRKDKDFLARVRENIERDMEVLDRLAR